MFYELENGDMSLTLSSFGATAVSLKYKGSETVLGYETEEEYIKNDGYLGASVGRVANRIANGEFTLNGVKYSLFKNDGENCLHGGNVGYSHREWKAEINGNKAVFTIFSPDGEENFPGNLQLKVTYTLYTDGVGIEYEAESDKDTPINFTNHTYFNLTSGKESVENHYLKLNASYITPVNEKLIPTGEFKKVDGTPFDFKKPKKIGEEINASDEQLKFAGGYDHNFVLDGKGFKKFAEVYCESSGITMDCYTDMPGVQVYSGNFLTKRKVRGGKTVDRRYGLCLETQFFPNSVNTPSFPCSILKAGEKFYSKTEYKFR